MVATGVVCSLGGTRVLDGIDLRAKAGEVHAILGPNGAGKTTLIRLLCGLVDPSHGSVSVSGAVGLVPSGDRTFYMRLSALENLIFFGRLHGLRLREARQRARIVLDEVGLAEVADRPVGRCSHGMQKRLSVARALLSHPDVLLVDEATHDLDPEGARRIRGLVRSLAASGTAVLWTTQRVEEVRDLADVVTFLRAGRVRFVGSPVELARIAPASGYTVSICGARGATPSASEVQIALGPSACVAESGTRSGEGEFLVVPDRNANIGVAIDRLLGAGWQVLGCRQDGSEIEEAFFHLSGEVAA